LQYIDVPKPEPKAGEALVKIRAAGINFIDVYHRLGRYAVPTPFTPGMEGAGVVEAIGPNVTEVSVGDRVAWATHRGSYAEYAAVPISALLPIPANLDEVRACALLLQGMTAQMLVTDVWPLKAGQTALVHAAAGGVGLLLTQTCKHLGAHVIATCSTEAKAALARQAGADEVILYSQVDFEPEVKRLTGGAGVDVVYDSVGQATFEKSLKCLRKRGLAVLFGSSSGPAPLLDPNALGGLGSLFVTRPSLFHYVAERADLLRHATAAFNLAASGALTVTIGHSYALKDAAQAHLDLEARATTGKLTLVP
jgi:NADPH2:quinone reductase